MKIAVSFFALFITTACAIAGNFHLKYSHVSYPRTNQVVVGKIKPQIEKVKIDAIQLVEFDISGLPSLLNGFKAEETEFHLYIYMASPGTPKINISGKDLSLIDLLDAICQDIGYSSWIQNDTIYLLPDEFIDALKPY